MYTIRVESGFAAAHFLRDYKGKCEKLHGHNYKVRVYVKGKRLNEGGMLFDFSEMKRGLGELVQKLDHGLLNDIPEFQDNPSAERIAKYLFNAILSSSILPESARLDAVEVFESDTSMARYEED
jgi:6-pyruvoyltetrahydropterin/6-carboxytetrahydropterin synthase